MKFTFIFNYWEEGSRPGRKKLNLVENRDVIEVDTLDKALDIFERRANHAIKISYHQSAFHSGYMFEGDVSDEPNPFVTQHEDGNLYTTKKWEIRNPDVWTEYNRWARGTECPSDWANLPRSEQQIVAATNKYSPVLAEHVARAFKNSHLLV